MQNERIMVFVRHPESIGNILSQDERAKLEIPNHKYPLSPRGREQGEITGNYLLDHFGPEYFDKLRESTFARASEAMSLYRGKMKCKIIPAVDSRLDEKWDGIFHELSKEEISLKYPEQIRLRKMMGYYHHRAPGGQNCPDVELSIQSFMNDFFSGDDTRKELISGHGRWYMIFQKIIFDWSVDEFLEKLETTKCENASVTVFRFIGKDLKSFDSITPWKGKILAVDGEYA